MSAYKLIGYYQLSCSQEVEFEGIIGKNIAMQVPYSSVRLSKYLGGAIKNRFNVTVFLVTAFHLYIKDFQCAQFTENLKVLQHSLESLAKLWLDSAANYKHPRRAS